MELVINYGVIYNSTDLYSSDKVLVRIEAPNYMNTLVGEAASFNIRANTQAVNFTNYILKLCDLGSLNGISLPLESLVHNVGTYLKNRFSTYFTHFWKDLNKVVIVVN